MGSEDDECYGLSGQWRHEEEDQGHHENERERVLFFLSNVCWAKK